MRNNESSGTGVVLYNTASVAHIDSCYFSYNSRSVRQDAMYRGGGVAVKLVTTPLNPT